MIKTVIVSLMLILSWHISHGQQSLQLKIVDEHTQEPLLGATVLIIGTSIGAVSNSEGILVLENLPQKSFKLRAQLMGYERKEVAVSWPSSDPSEVLVIALHEEHGELEAVVVNSTRSSRSIQDIPTRVEFIAGEELEEKANMKPGDIRMILSESTGILVQITSPTSANANIRIQGLDGRYTQLLKDGFPLYTGAASGLSLLQIPPLDLKQVEVIKGSASTLYGGGAIAGLVNLISKTPTEEGELSFLLNGTTAGGFDASGFYGKRNEKIGTTIFGAFNTNLPYDPADIGLSAIPKFERFTLNPRMFVYPGNKTQVELGLNFNQEDRKGGNMDLLRDEAVSQDAFFEHNKSSRISSQFVLNHELHEDGKIQFKNSINHFARVLDTKGFSFDAVQLSSFSEFNYQINKEKSDWVIGANYWTEVFSETQTVLPRDYSLQTIGVFAQNTWTIQPEWILESGLRTDYVPEFGWAVLPRLALLWKATESFSSRLGGGLGYKAPTIFTEESERLQFQNILPIDPQVNQLERSYGLNWDLNYKTGLFDNQLFLSINHLFFYTYLDRPLFLNPAGGESFRFVNIEGYSDTKGIETNIKWEYRDFKWFLGYTYTHARIMENSLERENPLTPRHRINSVFFYEVHDKWRVGYETYYFSEQQLSDGSVGQSYWIMGLMAEKIWERVSIFLNFENFLDARQTRFDSIFTGTVNNPVFREIYAPLDGFVINGGLKIRI